MEHKDPTFIKPDWSIEALAKRAHDGLSYSADREKLLEHAHNLLEALRWIQVNSRTIRHARAVATEAIDSAVRNRDPVE